MPYGLVGEEIGILVPRDKDDLGKKLTSFTVTEVLTTIDRAWAAKAPYSDKYNSSRYVLTVIMEGCGITKSAAGKLLEDWLINGILAVKEYDSHSKSKGLKVELWPG